ncbi:MAG: 3-oxoacyl-ACP reductase FabG [Peptococcaceae bacterium]|jgi:3-oxoacyl-[acyl-carrier protein] reductase|nr:3-oxoacyl-ACP reductase FabG [Peptococcaceae bacterium]
MEKGVAEISEKVLITGASRGIGYHLAEVFCRQGYRVYANYRHTEEPLRRLAETVNRQSEILTPLRADITQAAEVARMFAQTAGVDILIHNAGIAQMKPFAELTERDWDQMIAVHMKGAFLCAQGALPSMLARKAGCVILISSMWGVGGASCEVHYSAAKAGLIGFTKALAKELGPSGIRVNCLAPGVIATDMLAELTEEDLRSIKEQTPLARIGRVEDIAQAALFLAGHTFITGEVLNVNGGFLI